MIELSLVSYLWMILTIMTINEIIMQANNVRCERFSTMHIRCVKDRLMNIVIFTMDCVIVQRTYNNRQDEVFADLTSHFP